MSPEEAFNEKWPIVQRLAWARLRAYQRWDWGDDLLQTAALVLWRQCLRCPDPSLISPRLIVRAAFNRHSRPKLHTKLFSDFESEKDGYHFDAPAPDDRHTVNGIRLCPADLEMDHGRELDIIRNGIGSAELANRMGVTRAYVHLLRHELGGVCIDGRHWLFPQRE